MGPAARRHSPLGPAGRGSGPVRGGTHLLESLAIDRELDDRWGESIDLLNLGKVNERLGRYDDALACYQDALAINREADHRDGVAHCLNGQGAVHRRQGRHELALSCHRESLAIQREVGDPYCLAESLRELGLTLRATGCVEEARQHLAPLPPGGSPCRRIRGAREELLGADHP